MDVGRKIEVGVKSRVSNFVSYQYVRPCVYQIIFEFVVIRNHNQSQEVIFLSVNVIFDKYANKIDKLFSMSFLLNDTFNFILF